MGNVKISQLPSATTPLTGLEEVPIVQNNTTVKTNIESIRGGYKVYTALLTQSGGSNYDESTYMSLIKGHSYYINPVGGTSTVTDYDFSNLGGPKYPELFNFVATADGLPNSCGIQSNPSDPQYLIQFNTGAPVVKVIENTLGNIWFEFNNDGTYIAFSNNLFTLDKTFITIGSAAEGANNGVITSATPGTTSYMYICSGITSPITPINDQLYNTSFEIRVYN